MTGRHGADRKWLIEGHTRRMVLACLLSFALLAALLCAITVFFTKPASACSENTMLDFIGSLEAPGGYDTVYYGVKQPPPRPITSMTVREVLEWQRSAVKGGSVSSAAGRYQIIRPTLKRLVDSRVVSPDVTFDVATQDRLARHLLRETGYRAGDTSTATANRIARVWAALPQLGGPGAGRSAYQGIAGNHALVKSSTYRGVLECRIAVADTAKESGQIRAGRQFGFSLDELVEDLAETAQKIVANLTRAAAGLLLTLFTIDLVLRGGRWVFDPGQERVTGDLLFRLTAVTICLLVITYGGRIIAFMGRTAATLAGDTGARQALSMTEFAASKMALAFSLLEGIATQTWAVRTLVTGAAEIVAVLAGLQMAVILYWYARMFLGAAAGMIVLGFGGLTQTSGAAHAWMFSVMAAALSLMTLLLILTVISGLAWDVRSTAGPAEAAISVLFLEILALILILLLPKSASTLIRPRPA